MDSNQEFDLDEFEDDIEEYSNNTDNLSEIDYGNYEDDELDEPLYTNKDDIISKKEIEYEIKTGKKLDDDDSDDDADIDDIDDIDDIEDEDEDEDENENEDENEKKDDEIDIDEELEENERKKDRLKNKNFIDPVIQNHKKNNISKFSKCGIISYMCNLVNYIKMGGQMLDGRQEFNYPDETEESYAIESILLNTSPFIYVVNNKIINVKHEDMIIVLKQALQCVDEDFNIYFPKDFQAKFPEFLKNLSEFSVSIDEINEIKKIKKQYQIIE